MSNINVPIQHTNPFDNALLINITISAWGNHKKLPKHLLKDMDADLEMIGGHKKLVESVALRAVSTLDSQAVEWLKSRCLSPVFKRGIYLLPLALVKEVEQYLQEYKERRAALLETAGRDLYEGLEGEAPRINSAQWRLRAAYNAMDYPATAEAFKQRFALAWSYLEVNSPTKLQKWDPELHAQEVKKMQAQIQEVTQEIITLLRTELMDLVSHLQERLTGTDEKGRAKGFQESSVEKIREFVQTFQARNICSDASLEALVKKVEDLTSGVSPQALRTSNVVRNHVREGFAEVSKKLSGLITVRPNRVIQFADDPAEGQAA